MSEYRNPDGTFKKGQNPWTSKERMDELRQLQREQREQRKQRQQEWEEHKRQEWEEQQEQKTQLNPLDHALAQAEDVELENLSTRERWDKALQLAVSFDDMIRIAYTAVQEAIDGDNPARRWVSHNLVGKPARRQAKPQAPSQLAVLVERMSVAVHDTESEDQQPLQEADVVDGEARSLEEGEA